MPYHVHSEAKQTSNGIFWYLYAMNCGYPTYWLYEDINYQNRGFYMLWEWLVKIKTTSKYSMGPVGRECHMHLPFYDTKEQALFKLTWL